VSKEVLAMLMASAARDEAALWDTVQKRAAARRLWAEERLRQRARSEAEEMARILETQRAAIEKELAKRAGDEHERAEAARQGKLPFGPGWLPEEQEQKAQYDADTRHIAGRRADLDRELSTEPARIQELYEVKHHRLERLGLVYLWPATS
jgi:hypothetical protein